MEKLSVLLSLIFIYYGFFLDKSSAVKVYSTTVFHNCEFHKLCGRKKYAFHLLSKTNSNEGSVSGPHIPRNEISIFSCISLIAGTTIGGGFLALPAVTAPVGAFPACVCLIVCWAYLTGCALSLSSVIFQLSASSGTSNNGEKNNCDESISEGHNLEADIEFSIFRVAKRTFGNTAGAVAAGLYVVLMLSTLVAQLSKIGNISSIWGSSSRLLGISLFSGLMYAIAFVRDDLQIAEQANSVLTAVMLASFSAIISAAPLSGMDLRRWQRADFAPLLLLHGSSRSGGISGQPWAVPVFLQLLVYTEVVPVVCARLRDEKKVRKAIIIGATIPLLMCIVWTLVAVGLTPINTAAMTMMDDPIDSMMRSVQQFTTGATASSSLLRYAPLVLSNSVTVFALSAISTTVIGSLLTVSQFLVDIMSELMAVKSSTNSNTNTSAAALHSRVPDKKTVAIARVLSILCPAAIVAVGSKSLYYAATAFAGAFPVTLLWGLLPTAASLKLRGRSRTERSSILDKLLCIVSILMLIINFRLMLP